MPTTTQQIDRWRQMRSEHERLEFKEAKTQFDSRTLYKYCVAIANEGGGVLLLGIEDTPPRRVVGTNAFPNAADTANKAFQILKFRVDVEEVAHPAGRVLVFHIPSRPSGTAYQLDGAYWMRSGESLVPMSEDRLRLIFSGAEPALPRGRTKRRISLAVAALCLVALGWFGVKELRPRFQQTEKRESGAHTEAPLSFVYLSPGPWIVTGSWDLIVNHRGPQPSYNVEILFVDQVRREQVLSALKTSLTQADLDSYQFLRKFPEVDPKGRGSVFATQLIWSPPVPDHERYAIEITWRDGRVHQDLQIERVEDKWFWATQITDSETKRVLVNCKDKGFPYGPAGDKPCFPEMAMAD